MPTLLRFVVVYCLFDTMNLVFSSALINGYPFGAANPSLQTDDLYASATGPREIMTAYSASNKEAFATVFEHS